MDENKTNEKIENETAGENSSENTNQTNDEFLGWLTKYSDVEKYPPKPTPWFVYVLSLPAAFGVTYFLRWWLIAIAECIGQADVVETTFFWVICSVLFLAFFTIFVALYQCFNRYGFSETVQTLPKVFMLAMSIVLLALPVILLFFSPYAGIGSFLILCLLYGAIALVWKK